jgi:riboflavin kinase / FMN adenylyltransferase
MLPASKIITIGNFDGCHLGHQQLFKELQRLSILHALPHMVVSFSPSSRQFFYPDTTPIYMQSQNDARMKLLGIEEIFFQPFDKHIAELSKDAFIREFLKTILQTQGIVIGHDFCFGKDREGTIKDLIAAGFEVSKVDPYLLDGTRISSSWIRSLIKSGDVATAAQGLGDLYCMWGKGVRGLGVASTLGFPTCNLQTEQRCIPKDGVYAGYVMIDEWSITSKSNKLSHPALIHISAEGKIEAHIIDSTFPELYDCKLSFFFHSRLRNNQIGLSTTDLKNLIGRDISALRSLKLRS